MTGKHVEVRGGYYRDHKDEEDSIHVSQVCLNNHQMIEATKDKVVAKLRANGVNKIRYLKVRQLQF